jgi:hypothetical protein
MNDEKQIKDILTRLEKLEKKVFPVGKQISKVNGEKSENFSGTKGGILFLLSKGYFNQRRSAPDVKAELGKNDYHYSIQVVQTALNRLSKGKGGLVAMKEEGKKIYVKRR